MERYVLPFDITPWMLSKTTLRNQYLHPAIEQGLIKLTNPEKPNSSMQKYYKD